MDDKPTNGTPLKAPAGADAASPAEKKISPKKFIPVINHDKIMLAVQGVIPGDKRHMPIHKWDVDARVQLKSLLVSWAECVFKKPVTKIPDGVRVLGANQQPIVDFTATLGDLRRKLPVQMGRLTINLLWPNTEEDPDVAAKALLRKKAAAEKKAALERAEAEQKLILKREQQKLRAKDKKKDEKHKDKDSKKREKKKAKEAKKKLKLKEKAIKGREKKAKDKAETTEKRKAEGAKKKAEKEEQKKRNIEIKAREKADRKKARIAAGAKGDDSDSDSDSDSSKSSASSSSSSNDEVTGEMAATLKYLQSPGSSSDSDSDAGEKKPQAS